MNQKGVSQYVELWDCGKSLLVNTSDNMRALDSMW